MNELTYADIAERWGITVNTLRQWRFKGKLPEPDKRVGREPVWYEDTIKGVEDERALGTSDTG